MNVTELLKLTNMNMSPATVCINFAITFGLSLIIYIVYRMTYSGVAYAKSFNVSLVITAIVTAMVMMVIGNNLSLSLGMVGALSIVRFRSAVKEPKDITYIFWAIAVGLSAGTSSYAIAIVGTVFIAVVLVVFTLSNVEDMSYLLAIKGNEFNNDKVKEIINKNTKRSKIRTKNLRNDYKELTYEVYIKPKKEEVLIKELENIGISNINIIAFNNDIGR